MALFWIAAVGFMLAGLMVVECLRMLPVKAIGPAQRR